MSNDVRKISQTLDAKTTSTTSRKILKELKQISKSMQQANTELAKQASTPYQTTNSPYFPDRVYSNPLAVQDNPEETKWKEVSSYEDNHESWLSTEEEKANFVVINKQKLNII